MISGGASGDSCSESWSDTDIAYLGTSADDGLQYLYVVRQPIVATSFYLEVYYSWGIKRAFQQVTIAVCGFEVISADVASDSSLVS
jgi:hypothetical protein